MIKQITKAAFLWLLVNAHSQAVTTEITARFTPSFSDPTHNTFVNTTPQSGYCSSFPNQCASSGMLSIALGLTTSLNAPVLFANAPPRESAYFKIPAGWQEVTVTNQGGESYPVQFRFSALAGRYLTRANWSANDHSNNWLGGAFSTPSSPCSYSAIGFFSTNYYHFIWKWPVSNSACYKIPAVDLTGDPYLINNISAGYELKTPEPLKMGSGLYTGSINLRVGPGGDIDFGDVYTANDDMLTLNFSLSVNHELQLQTLPEDHSVALQPCPEEKICTEDEGKMNWERSLVTNIAPHLTGRSRFTLSSSGSFTVYLHCEYQHNNGCAVKSEKSDQQVPVQSLLTLPTNILSTQSGTTVSRKLLSTQKDAPANTYKPQSFGQQQPGNIDFVINKRDVETMLRTQPDTYSGMVTVLFDPNLF